jgi:hypothetical protein
MSERTIQIWFLKFGVIRTPAILLVLFFIGSGLSAQPQNRYQHVIYLKSGEKVRGTLTDTLSDAAVTIMAGDTMPQFISRSEIKRIGREKNPNYKGLASALESSVETPPDTIRYQGILEVGYNIADTRSDLNYLAANFINGIGFGNQGSAGLGIGIRSAEDDPLLLPVFFDFRLGLLDAVYSPSIGGGLGTVINAEKGESSGQFYYVNIGLRKRINKNSAFLLTLGYEVFDRPSIFEFSFYGNSTINRKARSVALRIGISF